MRDLGIAQELDLHLSESQRHVMKRVVILGRQRHACVWYRMASVGVFCGVPSRLLPRPSDEPDQSYVEASGIGTSVKKG